MRSDCQSDRRGDRAPSPFRLRRSPPRSGAGQVIQRTQGEDNSAERQKAGPVAARVLPYALLAEQSYDPKSMRLARPPAAPRACAADDPKDCDARADDQRAARWLDEWRYVWSCSGADECGVQTAGQGERVSDGLGVQIWARKGVRCPEAVIAFRGTVGGNKGDWESNFHWSYAPFQSTISTSKSATMSAISSAISSMTSATTRARPRLSPSATH